ncbi:MULTISPECIES: DNA polymerase I [Brevundimonas]|jgi:DNA polymerase I|uniref:DNA polymerase I n=5 Tax=Brevundimonas mediterranea TaxID=74329 RepID=A0AB37E686_9CAUL|nr:MULTISPECIES: DNA polymerase I [Brevundimonas]EDX79114.1 DNA polymerase I superfamily [Brevundimonas sp. BAL3]MBA4332571.1 DNA polymerase I [Brevundimonas sp.]QIH72722.1 DNA polymerase I [Brevundimonas mediterranea]
MTDASAPQTAPEQDRPLTQDGPALRLWMIDASAYIFRAYHALPPLTRKSDGLPVGAVQGYCNMLWKLLKDMKGADGPTHLVAIFDHSDKTFRNTLYDQYKAHRPPAPEDLVPQFPLVREATAAFGVHCVELPGYEADDLIATYACKARDAGGEAVIVSSDKDLMQLIGGGVVMWDPMKDRRLAEPEVFEKFGVGPEKMIDLQALIGDSVDNVPGAPGIGPKTAAQLLDEYGDLDALLARAGEIKQPKRRETLINFADQIRLSRELVRLTCDAPAPEPIEDFAVRDPDPETLSAFLDKMEFRSLQRRVGDGRAGPSETSAFAPKRAPNLSAPVATPRYGQVVEGPAEAQIFDLEAYECVQTEEALDRWIARAVEAGSVGFDTETSSLSATHAGLCGVSLAVGPNEACYIPLTHEHEPQAGEGGLFGVPGEAREPIQQLDKAKALAKLKVLLENPSVLKVLQNAKYDLAVMARRGIRVAPYDDTMLISYVLEGGLHGHGMDELARLHLGHDPVPFKSVAGTGKSQKSFRHVALKPATQYAAEDADVTLRLWRLLKPRLAREGLSTVYETLERPLPAVLAEMETAGVRIDPDRLKRLSSEFGLRMAELEAQAHEIAGRPFNIGSPRQIGEILFGELNLPGGKKTASGQWGTDASVLEDLAATHALPRVLLDWRQLSKLKGTYTDALTAAADPATDRVHTSYQLAAATTGRLASSDPNLQNIPIRTETGREIRQAFIAAPGHLLISADYSQIELRLLAHIGDIPELKRAFKAGLDIHAATASEMFGVPVEGMPSETRRRAKAINFGIVYGISAFGLAAQLGIDQGEAGAYIKTYFDRFPGIRTYMDKTRAEVRQAGFVSTVFGRRIHIPAIHSKSGAERQFGERAAINAPIQGAAADIIRRAMIRMPTALAEAGLTTRMLLQVHDELVFETPEAEADRAITVIKRVMETASDPAVALTVPLVVDARAAPNWDAAH